MTKDNCLAQIQCSHHIETSQLNCSANELTGFYMIEILIVNALMKELILHDHITVENFLKSVALLQKYTPGSLNFLSIKSFQSLKIL